MGEAPDVVALLDDELAAELSLLLAADEVSLEAFGDAGAFFDAADERSPLLFIVDAGRADAAQVVSFAEARVVLVIESADPALLSLLPRRVEVVAQRPAARLLARLVVQSIVRRRGSVDGLTGAATKDAHWRRQTLLCRADGPTTLIMLDIDHFKRINDAHGHHVGDQILRAVANRLAGALEALPDLGADVFIARLGGEEFGVSFFADEARGLEVAEALLDAVRQRPCAGLEVRVSAGVATRVGPTDPTLLSQAADEALYSAKAHGRDRVVGHGFLTRHAEAHNRDVAVEAFESRTKVIAERVADAITTRGRKLFGELQKRADIDPVTGLFSRGYLDRRLAFELGQATENDQPLTIALVDLDHFGEVNKTYGWPTGDEALKQVSEALAKNVRSSDWVARYGGEELCIVMFGAGLTDARGVLERLLGEVSALEITASDGRRFGLTVSIGAASRAGDEGAAAILERASERLLEAKRAGRNRLTA